MLTRSFLLIICLGCSTLNQAQVTNTGLMDTVGGIKIEKLTIGAYIDLYYGMSSAKMITKDIPYMVSMARDNEFNVNLALIDFRYTDTNLRARFAPGFGTYMNANYAGEPGTLRNIVEASVGFRLSKKREIWMDAGILGSPYTNESAISKDHLMYTRSLAPEYVPYYLAGVKIGMPLGKKINAFLYLVNGWQQIRDNNSGKSLGTQVEYRPNKKNLFNWNTYIGDERSNFPNQNRMRYFTDVFWIFNPEGKWSMTSCAYIGNQKRLETNNSLSDNYWWQYNLIGRYSFNSKWSLSGRIEYFEDLQNVQINSIGFNPEFKTFSAGLCLNFKAHPNAMIRLEARQFHSPNEVYRVQNSPSQSMFWGIANITTWF
jgi:hypothetical protein